MGDFSPVQPGVNQSLDAVSSFETSSDSISELAKGCIRSELSFSASLPAITASVPEGAEKVDRVAGALFDIENLQIGELVKKAEEILKKPDVSPQEVTFAHKLFDKAAAKAGSVEEATRIRAQAASLISIPKSHPLSQFKTAVETQTAKSPFSRCGAHFSSLDSGNVKGGNVRVFSGKINGEQKVQADFKIGLHLRYDLRDTLEQMKTSSHEFDFCDRVVVREVKDTFFSEEEGDGYTPSIGGRGYYYTREANALEIEFEGVGRVRIGNTPEIGCLYNHVTVEIDGQLSDEKLLQMQKMCTAIGLGPVFCVQMEEDDKRLQVAMLFRAFFPEEAASIERKNEFYQLPVDELMGKIIENVPDMEKIFDKYLDSASGRMEKVEIYPGKMAWAVSDIALELKNEGAWGVNGRGRSFT